MEKNTANRSLWKRITSRSEFSIFVGLVVLCILMSFLSEYFLKLSNIFNILNQISRYGIVSVGMAMGKILSGCTLLLTQGRPIKFQSSLAWLGKGYIGPIPVAVIVMLLTILLGSIFAQKTFTGRNIYAIGNNERTAQLSGINVKALKTLTYVITSTLCALCGVIVAGNLSSADATLGVGYETDTIAAVVIGGVAMSGGEGTIWGSLLGAAIIGILKNAFVLLRMDEIVDALYDGIVGATIGQDPFGQGTDPVIFAYNAVITGEEAVTGNEWTKMDVVTPDNVAEYYPR